MSLSYVQKGRRLTPAVDDCWSIKDHRDPNTQRIIPDPTKFPNGISGLASQIHGMGLKVGIYSSTSPRTHTLIPHHPI